MVKESEFVQVDFFIVYHLKGLIASTERDSFMLVNVFVEYYIDMDSRDSKIFSS